MTVEAVDESLYARLVEMSDVSGRLTRFLTHHLHTSHTPITNKRTRTSKQDVYVSTACS
jgi:hypothetical protein